MFVVYLSINICTVNQRDFAFGSNTQLTFTSGSLVACVDIDILDDSDIEGNHQFEVMITDVTLGDIMISLSITTIMIMDNSGIHLLILKKWVNKCTVSFCRWDFVISNSS